jgi:hypothetical protein
MMFCLALILTTHSIVSAAPPQKNAKWTVMVYISGDNDLESYVVKDIETELAPAGSNEDVQVVALADRIPGDDASAGDWTVTLLFHVTPGMTAVPENAVEDWGERNFGDPQTLVDFVSWTKSNYPADHYALYLWGHGWNWHPGYVMWDETDNDTLDAHEIASVLPSLGFIDMVGFDGCNMASIEVHALWHGYATAMVASQEYVNWDGLEYELIIPALHNNPAMTADELAIVSSQSASVNNERTESAIAIDARWDNLLTAVDEWAVALQTGLPDYKTEYTRAFRATQDFWAAPMDKDLYDMASEINARVNDPDIQAKSQAVMAAIDAVVLDEWHTKPYHDAHGITIYLITKTSQIDSDYDYYQTLDFSQMTHWDEFIAAFLDQ